MKNYILVGKIGAPYGIRGWLKIHSYTEFGASILHYSPWYLQNRNWQQVEVEEGKPHGKGIIVKLRGFDSPELAGTLSGQSIAITRDQLPPLKKNEYYWADLIGLTVINQDNKRLGHVGYLIETGSNDVLVIKGDKEIAIPYLPGESVLSVDLEKGEIHVKWEE